MQLDKDIRALSAYLSSTSTTSARAAFGRLSQVVVLLGLTRETEVFDYWSPSGGAEAGIIRWKLSAPEVRRAMALRVDFRKSVIDQLAL